MRGKERAEDHKGQSADATPQARSRSSRCTRVTEGLAPHPGFQSVTGLFDIVRELPPDCASKRSMLASLEALPTKEGIHTKGGQEPVVNEAPS
jgi:hypothetical protein